MLRKLGQIIYGVSSSVPGLLAAGDLYCRLKNPSTSSARYCYSVWLRHLTLIARAGLDTEPRCLAEIGPGRSLGVGLAALLCGAERYRGLDVVAYANVDNNLAVFDELVGLLQRREPIPGDDEFPLVCPKLDAYAFPAVVLTPARMAAALAPARVASLRAELCALGAGHGRRLAYWTRWNERDVLAREQGSVDLLLSQAALEHVDDLPAVYESMATLLSPGGCMSHQIDFTCHGMSSQPNGHWTYSDRVWALMRGKRPYALNRAAHSVHHRLLAREGMVVVADVQQLAADGERGIPRARLATPFAHLSDNDLRCRGACIVSVKPAAGRPRPAHRYSY